MQETEQTWKALIMKTK